jgi:leucyl aminopeptidase
VLAEEASKIASTYSDVFTATILDVEKCKELKMGSYLAVAAASANPPHFIHLCYKPTGGNVKRKLAIVGKGLTFDRFVAISSYFMKYVVILFHRDGFPH